MLAIGNSLVEPDGGKHWIYQVAPSEPVCYKTDSNEHTFNIFLEKHKDYKDIVIVFSDFVHQHIGNIVYSWSNDNYLDINHTRRRDMVMMGHTPNTLVQHNMAFYNAIKQIRPDAVLLTEWAKSEFCIVTSILQQESDLLYSKQSLSDQFIRWCNIHNISRQIHANLNDLINDSSYYTHNFDYTEEGHSAIAKLYESARSSVG